MGAFTGNIKTKLFASNEKVKKGYVGASKVYSSGNIVTYYVDSGITYQEEVEEGASCIHPKTFTPTKSGWTFLGWRASEHAVGSVYGSSEYPDLIMEGDPISLYAVFKKAVTVTYYDSTTAQTTSKDRYYNNGNVANPSFTLTQSTISGWTPRGWSTGTAGNSSITYNNATAFTRDSDCTLYGMYQQTITVTYYNGSTTASTTTGIRYYNRGKGVFVNPSFTLTQATKSGWSAVGWTTGTAGNSGITYNNATAFTRDSNVTLYGRYNQTITLSYNGNGSTGGSTASHTGTRCWNSGKNVYVNPSFTLKSNGFTKTDYGFSKWAQGSASGTQYAAGASVTLSASTTFYAIWTLVNKYLYSGATNEGGFVGYRIGFDQYAGDGASAIWCYVPTVTKGASLGVSIACNGGCTGGSVISNAINVTNYKKVTFTYSYNCGTGNKYNGVDFGIVTTKKEGRVTPVKSQSLMSSAESVSGSGTVTVDISSLTGNVYFVFYIKSNVNDKSTTLNISNMYLQP